jgi:hypothetical protein
MKRWLAPYDWAFVTEQNAMLCLMKNALHKPTSDGHEATRQLWEAKHGDPMSLGDAAELCRRCHRMAPFCFYNGNTFVAIMRDVIARLALPPSEVAAARSLAGHIVAGVASEEEERAFREFCDALPDDV